MTNYFVDSTTGSDSNNGTTMDLAWATVEHAVESGGLSAGDIVWVRNIHSEIPTSNIQYWYDGSASEPIQIIGWPRPAIPNTTITQADFTQGSKIIENIVGITIDRSTHLNRYMTAPDGKQYHISAILYGFTVDGMAAGYEFIVGEGLTNTTQTKNGKVWGFVDNGDTTGIIHAVVDSSTTWLNNDNVTSTGGGDAELSMDATPVGFLLSSNYVGSTVTGTDGKFEIQEDPDYDLAQAIDDSGWIINKSTWNADADTLPLIDFNDGAFFFSIYTGWYWILKNLEIKDSSDIHCLLKFGLVKTCAIEGLLLKQTTTKYDCFQSAQNTVSMKRIIIEGCYHNDNSSVMTLNNSNTDIKDLCCYNGHFGIYFNNGQSIKLNNVNSGVEICNKNNDVKMSNNQTVIGRNVGLGGSNGYVSVGVGNWDSGNILRIERFQKILNNHITFRNDCLINNVDIGDSSAPSIASIAGSILDIVCIQPNTPNYDLHYQYAIPVFDWKIWASASAETYTVYFQNNLGVTLNGNHAKEDIWLKLTYINSHNNRNITERELFSTETNIAQRSSDTDWGSLTIASHTPAIEGWVTLELFVSKYVASGQIYVDPKYV